MEEGKEEVARQAGLRARSPAGRLTGAARRWRLEELGLGSARARLLGGLIEVVRSDELGAQELLDADLTAPDGWMIGGSGEGLMYVGW